MSSLFICRPNKVEIQFCLLEFLRADLDHRGTKSINCRTTDLKNLCIQSEGAKEKGDLSKDVENSPTLGFYAHKVKIQFLALENCGDMRFEKVSQTLLTQLAFNIIV